MPAFPEHTSDHASSASNTDPISKQYSTVGSSATPYPSHPSRNAKPRDSLDIEPVDEGEKEIWRNVRQELRQMLDDAREHLESMIKANPDRQAALRKEHEEETVVNCRKMAFEHYLEELAHEREERLWLSGQKPSPSLVKQQHGIMNRIQSSTGGATSSNTSASTSGASSSTAHIDDTRTKVSSSPPADVSESRVRNDSRSSMSRPLPSFTQQPYHIPPLPPQLEAARRTSHGSAGANHRDDALGDAVGHDTHWARHAAFDDELRRPPSTSTSSLRSKASLNEFPAAPGLNGTSPTKPSIFEHPRTSSDRHHATSPPGNKPTMDEFWTPTLLPEEEATAASVTKQHYPMDRRSSDASLRSMSSVASSRHPPSETIPARVDKVKDRELHERKNKDYFSASNLASTSRSPSSVSPAPGISSSYPKSRAFDDAGIREREYSDSPHISTQYSSRAHQGGMDDWPQYPSVRRKSSRLNDPASPYEPYQYPSQTPYQDPAVRPTVMRSSSYSRPYANYDMLDDPPPRLYGSHSQSIPVPHRSPNPATMASSVDQPESFTGQSPGWRDWKSHQSPIPEDYTGAFKSSSRNSFEARYNSKIDEPSEQPEHPAWRRRTEPWFREISVREGEMKRLEEDLKKKESELISEKTELRIREDRFVEREERFHTIELGMKKRAALANEREKELNEEKEGLFKITKKHEEGARRRSEEAQKLKEEALNTKEEARKLMDEAQKSMEEVRAKESEVVKREEVVKDLEASTKELHARVEQTEKSFEAREKELKEKEHALKRKEEEMKKREEDFKKKVTDAKKKDLALNHRSDDISNRERAISSRENEVKRKEEDLANREQDIRSRERDAEMSKYDLEDRASSVVERERDVEMREDSLLQAKKEIEAHSEDLKKQWNDLQRREHELLNKMKQKLEDEVPKEDEMERDREKREEEEKAHDREKREESEREEQNMKDKTRRMQREREIQEEQKAREERRRHVEEEERQRANEERRIKEEVMKGRARRQEEKERRQEEKERREEEKEKRQWGIEDEERSKEEERKRQQELREAREKEEKEKNRIAMEAERDERFKQEQERMRQQMEHQQREARKRRDSSGPDNFWSSNSASGSNRVPPTRANSTTIPEGRGTPGGPSGWGASAGSSGWGSSSGTSTGSSGWTSSSGTSAGTSGWGSTPGASAWSSAKATSASSTASSKTQRKPSTNFGAHSSTSGTEKPKSIEEQNQATREKFRLEQERQETLRQAKLATAGRSTGDMMQAYIYHENQWETLPKHDLLYWDSFPWPMFTLPTDAEQITAGAIWAYLRQDVYLAKDKPVSIKDRIKDQIKKWHPDRFETKLLPKVVEDQKEMVREGAGNVARCLNDLLEKAPSLMGW